MVVSSSSGRVYRPSNSERLILHLKNTNLVQRDKWGSNMLTAWLLQVLTHKGFYDSDLEWVGVENVLFVFSLSSSEGISPRFLAKNLVYNLSPPGRTELKIIYGELIKSILPSNKLTKLVTGLANTMVNIYLEVSARLGSSQPPHYMFTPANITAWCQGLLRYPLIDNQCVIEALLYEALRQFGDKLMSDEDRNTLMTIFSEVMEREFNLRIGVESLRDILFVSESPGRLDGTMLRLTVADCTSVVEKTLNQLGDTSTLVLPELVQLVARAERVLSSSGGSIVLAGRSGVGRKTAVRVVAARHSATVHSPNITHNYSLSNFKNDLKNAMQLAAVEGEQVYFLLEDYQILHHEFLDLINSLLSSGEVPGLYQSEELEATASVLKDAAAQSNFDGNVSQYFASRVQQNLHVVLVLESSNDKFDIYCQNNPALLKCCSVLWLDSWSQDTMTLIPRLILSRVKSLVGEDVFRPVEVFKAIHVDCAETSDCSPRRFFSFVQTYLHIYQSRIASIAETRSKLEAGVSKLTAAKQMVDTLKLEASEQGRLLADKQAKATAALEMITETMTNANAHRGDMDQLKVQTEKENQLLQIRKREIEGELADIQPLIEEARTAVGNIKSEALSEIRSLRAPPEVIRDILEGVLRLMGIQDTSWNSMKTFLAKRGVKEDIRCFDARNISSDNREAVEVLLSEHRESFNPKTAKRASQAAAPLAAWVTANVKFSHVLDKIKPLEREQANLHRNLKLAEERIDQLSSGLQDVDKTVAELKDRLNRFTKEAAELEIHLGQAEETLSSAENLVHKLDEEYSRWKAQLNELSASLSCLPHHSLLAAAFVTYLSAVPQDARRQKLEQWCEALEVTQFSLTQFLCSERQQLLWQSQGLPADQLSVENAAIITTISDIEAGSCQSVYILDPSSTAISWFRNSLREDNVEVVSQASPRFHTTLDLAVRFGKKLIIQDADGIEPTVYPVLRGDKGQQDGRKSLRLYHVSRNGAPLTEPHVSALLCQVNYSTTEAGLTEQLVQSALRQEKPQLEVRRGELLRREEELKMSLHQLQDTVLQELANAHGDILHNKELLSSLNETKRSASAISESLEESARLKAALQAECDVYRGLAVFGARLFFAIGGLSRLNNMYRLSISAFLAIFNDTVATSTQDEVVWKQILLQKVYLYMARALFKEDTLTFALHLAHAMCPSHFQPNEWEVLTGQAVAARGDPSVPVPSWVPQDRVHALSYLQSVLPQLYGRLQLESESSWKHFPQTEAQVSLSSFQKVLLVQALRPDLLHSALTKFAQQALGVSSLSPPPLRLSQLLSETKASEPVLILTGAGTDPSQELRQLALSAHKEYHEIALGEGQETTVSQLLSQMSTEGQWLCLKNLHLMSSWLPSLEHQLTSLSPHPEFRLWLTSEPHHKFPPMLVTACLKVTYEAPRGIKRNLMRSYCSWEGKEVSRAQFALAWFHAVVQERRTFIPQGWAKLYEFNDTDLHAALHVLRQRLSKDGRQVKWQYIQGLGESAIYGGRVDNVYDLRVLSAYLRTYFNNSVFLDNAPLAPGVYVPHSSNSQDHKSAIEKLSDQDPPSFFGLPANVDRSWQRITSAAVFDKLKVVGCEVDAGGKVDQQAWLEHLSPILNLWKKLNQGSGYIKMKLSDTDSVQGPIVTFLWREFHFGVALIQKIHHSLSGVTRVIKGAGSTTKDLLKLVDSLLLAKTPEAWAAVWDGPTNVTQYLQSITSRVSTLNSLKDNYSGSIDLSTLFHPDVFFSSLRHQASRDLHLPADAVQQQCSWSAVSEPVVTAVHGLQLEGATLSGGVLTSNTAESADVSTVSALYVYWTNKSKQEDSTNWIAIPLYRSAVRDSVITELKVPSRANEHSKWILAGTAFYIRG